MVSSMAIHCPLDIVLIPRGGGDFLVPRPQLCLPRMLIFCRAKQLGQSPFPDSAFGETPVHVIENFPRPPETGRPVPATPQRGRSDSKSVRALLQVSVEGPSGTLPPHILYLLELGFDLNQIQLIVQKYPPFADYSLESKVRPMIEFLLDLGVSKSDLPSILIKYPRLCGMALPENLFPSLAVLETLGVDKSKWPKVIFHFPKFLTYSRKKVEANVEFLRELDLSNENIGKIVTRCPQIVGHSVEEKLRPSVEYFQSLGVDAARLILYCPQVMNLSLENNLKISTEFFLENGFSIEEVGAMISRFGSLYKFSLKGNVVPKLEFFLTMNYSMQDLVNHPQYFGYSLEERIKPRYNLVKRYGVKFSLPQLLSTKDDRFAVLVEKRIENLLSDKSCSGSDATTEHVTDGTLSYEETGQV